MNQLQDVIDKSNILVLRSGNPNLRQQTSHFGSIRYIFTNTQKGQSLVANVFGQMSDNYITNATYRASSDSVIEQGNVLNQGAQLIKPINLDGYRNIRGILTYSMPLTFIKSNLNVNSGISYSRLPGQVNYVNNVTNNYAYNAGAGLSSNVSEYVDFNISYGVAWNTATNSVNAQSNNKYITQRAELQANLLSKNGWFLQNDVRNETYSGLSAGFNQSFWLWNAAIGKKFLKNNAGELKLSVFDLLKQNQSISREITANYIQDVQTQVLQQYFMLTFTYNLKNFGSAPARGRDRNDREGNERMQRGGRPGEGGPPRQF